MTTCCIEEALNEEQANHFEKAEAAWILTVLRRIQDGEDRSETELTARFVDLHGREPEVMS